MKHLVVTEIIKTRTLPVEHFDRVGKWEELDCSFEEAIKEKIAETKDNSWLVYQVAKFYYDSTEKEIAWNCGVEIHDGIIFDTGSEEYYKTFEEYEQKAM